LKAVAGENGILNGKHVNGNGVAAVPNGNDHADLNGMAHVVDEAGTSLVKEGSLLKETLSAYDELASYRCAS
jgi:hypothetical protein